MNEVVTAALLFTAVGLLFVGLGVPLLRGRVRPNSWYGCRTEKTLSDEEVWYAVNRVTGKPPHVYIRLALCVVCPRSFASG